MKKKIADLEELYAAVKVFIAYDEELLEKNPNDSYSAGALEVEKYVAKALCEILGVEE